MTLIHDGMERTADAPERAALRVMRDKALKERLVQDARDVAVRREIRRLQIEKPELTFYKFREHVLELFPEREEKVTHKNKCRLATVCKDGLAERQEVSETPNALDVLTELLATNKLMVDKLDSLSKEQTTTTNHLSELTKVLSDKLDKAILTRGNRSDIICDFCKRTCHLSKNCWQKNCNPKQGGAKANPQENPSPPS